VKADELRLLSAEKLQEQLDSSYQEMFNLRFQKVTGKLTNTSRMRVVRRDVARIKMIMRDRELEAESL